MSTQSWDAALLARTAKELRRLRKEQGLSAQKVADRTAELGQAVSRTTVADIENGRRKYISVAELLLLAAALNTTPAAMLFPGPYGDGIDVEILPNTAADASEAAQWFGGTLSKPPAWADPEAYGRNRQSIASAYAKQQQRIMEQIDEIKRTFTASQEKLDRWVQAMQKQGEEREGEGQTDDG